MTGNVDNNVGDVIPTKPQVIHNKITATDYERLLAACANDKARVLGGANDDLWAAEKYKHSHDASYHEEAAPDLVVYPLTTEETSAIMAICHERGLPVTASGARTGLEGGCIPVQGGVTLDLSRMNKILEHHEADAQVTVQCGIMKKDMQEFASEKGMFFAMDPGSEASIGGYASTGASGTLCTAKYGTMRDNVIRMRVVLPDGRTFWTRQRAIKSSAGYDLNHLFMGTEGSLGIITELCILLHPKPASMVGAVAVFPTLRHAAKAVIKIHHSRPSSLARCELLNTIAIRSVNNLFPQQYEETPTIFFEFHGTDEGTTAIAHAKYIESLCDDATSYRLAETEEEREKLWEARRGCYFASFKSLTATPDMKVKLAVTDVCVPISEYAHVIADTERSFAASKTGLVCNIVGHAEDGNFHGMIPFDINNKEMVDELRTLTEQMVKLAISVGGTATGEHGVGLGKAEFLQEEHGEVFLDVMKSIKAAIDPKGIMNPGKIFPQLKVDSITEATNSFAILREGQNGCC